MSAISVNRESMESLLARQTAAADGIERSFDGLPEGVDGGIASQLIGLVVTASVETSARLADTHRLLAGVAADVLKELDANEEQAASELAELANELGER